MINSARESAVIGFKVSKSSLVDSVSQQIKKMILNKELRPGDSLPSQRKFAIQLGVGTPTIREALKSLASIGLVRIEHGRSTIVRRVDIDTLISGVSPVVEMTEADVVSIFEAEDIIESRCAELAAKRITNEELEVLKDLISGMEKHKNDMKEYSAADYEFHTTVVNAARNPLITGLMKIIRRMGVKAIEETVLLDAGLAKRALAMKYHRQILLALKNRDAARAGRLAHLHMQETIKRYSRARKVSQ